ncbi:osteomodulin-like [Polyodon spathula]|uniref:osteomodulin-like n=1 Tax=Polyodon spathula TaxID=7913 RepID=UPI001B7DDB01|nr:osteomodulin-like [Polyodon spathula]
MGILTQISILVLLFEVNVLSQDFYLDPDTEPPLVKLPTFSYSVDSGLYYGQYVQYSYECASQCFCPPSYPFAMHCDNRNLKIIPNVPHHIRHLYLQFNSIEAVRESSFFNATSLTEINLSHNKIKSSAVDRDVFVKMKNLLKLHLEHNNLETVPAPLPSTLQRLSVGFNQISKLSADALQNLLNLTMLDLCNNKLTDSAFKGKILLRMKSLMQINLCNNKLKSMPTDLPASLMQLSLENNFISSIPVEYFKKTPNLMALRLSYNKLQEVPYKVFNLSSLMELNLGFNKLTKAFFIPRSLEHLYLNHNEFVDLNVSLMCPSIDYAKPNLLTYIRIDQNKLKDQLNNYVYTCFPRIQIIYYGEQKVIQHNIEPPVFKPVLPRFSETLTLVPASDPVLLEKEYT